MADIENSSSNAASPNHFLTEANKGFGPLWRKHFAVELTDSSMAPEELIALWKREFGQFWPGRNRFQAPFTGLKTGELAEVDLELPAGGSLSTGVRLLETSNCHFVLVAPPGHIITGVNTFSASRTGGTTTAHVDILMRASDPLFALGLALGGHRRENSFWLAVLANLAHRCGSKSPPTASVTRLDRKILLRNIGNIRRNALLVRGYWHARNLVSRTNAVPRHSEIAQ